MRYFTNVFAVILLLTLMNSSEQVTAFTRDIKQEVKRLFDGKLYLNINAPCIFKEADFSIQNFIPSVSNVPLIMVSPDGVKINMKRELLCHDDGDCDECDDCDDFGKLLSTSWIVRINDLVNIEEIDFEKHGINIELEEIGGRTDKEGSVIRLVNLHSISDVHSVFNLAFSKEPLQVAHDDWDPEIKRAINQSRIISGMTRKQVFCVTGHPEAFERHEEPGKVVETWFPFQAYQLPRMIKFENGILVSFGDLGPLQLDD